MAQDARGDPAHAARGWGRIITTASAHSLVASPNKSAYVAAKHGVVGITRPWRWRWRPTASPPTASRPLCLDTPGRKPDSRHDKARGLSREQVIDDVLLKAQPTKEFVTIEHGRGASAVPLRDEAKSITGANLSVDGGWTAQ